MVFHKDFLHVDRVQLGAGGFFIIRDHMQNVLHNLYENRKG